MEALLKDYDKLYINGEWSRSVRTEFEPVFNPATGDVIGEAPVAEVADVEAAIAAARHAFDHGPWPHMSMSERISILEKFLNGLLEREKLFREVLRLEVGSTEIVSDLVQWGLMPSIFRYGLDLAARMRDKSLPLVSGPNPANPSGPPLVSGAISVYDPKGVVAAITPYNLPLVINIGKIVPALVTGNTVVLKPSQFTPYLALMLGEVASEIGLPKGTLNIVTGGVLAGEALTSHPDVDMITFTGSDTVGAAIMAQAAPTLKRLHFELGGKSALIVRADADLAAAAAFAVGNIAFNAGQGCRTNSRWLVHNSVRSKFIEIARQLVSQMKIGNPADPTSFVGPLIREQARAKTERFVEEALAAGSRLIFGGKRPEGLDRGYFYEPTLFDDVDNSSGLAQNEVFGPVGAMMGFDTDDEAVALANASNFGLHGGIFSTETATALDMARRIRSGQVWINGGPVTFAETLPFGGCKRSGFGREFGENWLLEFLEEKAIAFPIG